jgi:hypothetical protein
MIVVLFVVSFVLFTAAASATLNKRTVSQQDEIFNTNSPLNKDYPSNINGPFSVKYNHHYSNKSTVIWGKNGATDWNVRVSLSQSAAIYDCSNNTETGYYCEDASYMYDWNKLWGKARCGYTHDHHDDSDRFVFRKCSDSSCAAYPGNSSDSSTFIQIGAYSYDNSIPPYTTGGLLKEFQTLIVPDRFYTYQLIMDVTGLSTFILKDGESGKELERQAVQHTVTCEDNYYEGIVDGLYFGGTCRAPIEIIAIYESNA